MSAVALLLASTLFASSQTVAPHAAVTTSSRYATQAGLEVLRRGGNAADAAIAVTFMLGVAEPKTAGIGGGGALMYYDAKADAVWTLDFRENAPAGLTGTAPRSGVAAIGVPSTVAGMGELHRRFGSQSWKDLVEPAARAADGDLAKTLKQLASSGPRIFYDGPIASRIVEKVRKAGGILSLHDLSEYKPIWRAPIEIAAGDYQIDSLAPPSAAGIMIAAMLGIAGDWDLKPDGAWMVHIFAEVQRRAAFDRDRFFAENPLAGYREILSAEHAKQAHASIDPARATPSLTLGEPAKPIAENARTADFAIVDAAGNIAAVSVSLDDANGSDFLVPGSGFVLNDAAKNAARAGDRIPSSMTPAIVLRHRKPMLAIGSSGGAMAPAVVLQVILGVTRFGMTLRDAIEAPRFDQQATPDDITYERTRMPAEIVPRLTAMGHGVRPVESIGGVNAILIEPGRLTAVADSRHAGVAGGM